MSETTARSSGQKHTIPHEAVWLFIGALPVLVLGSSAVANAQRPSESYMDAPSIEAGYMPEGGQDYVAARKLAVTAIRKNILADAPTKASKTVVARYLVRTYCETKQTFDREAELAYDRALVNLELRQGGLEQAYDRLRKHGEVTAIPDFDTAAAKQCPEIVQLTKLPDYHIAG